MSPRDNATQFSAALTAWFERNGYKSAWSTNDNGMNRQYAAIKIAVGILKTLAHASSPMFVSGDFNARKIAAALAPLAGAADVLGYKLNWMNNKLILAFYADAFSEQDVTERVQLCFKLAQPLEQFGFHYNGTGNLVQVRPLFVFFEPAQYARLAPTIVQSGYDGSGWKRVFVRSVAIDVQSTQLTIAAIPRAQIFGKRFGTRLDTKGEPFGPPQLAEVLVHDQQVLTRA
jgi:hypothetical protein